MDEFLHEMLCLCWREGMAVRHAQCQDSNSLQKKQWRLQWLQQLKRYLPAQYCGQSLCQSLPGPPTDSGSSRLPRVTVWVPGQKVHRHGVLHTTTEGETKQAPIPRLHRSDEGVWPCQYELSFQDPEKVGCPPPPHTHTKLVTIIQSFHKDIKNTVCYSGVTSEPFPICSGVKQGCVLASTVFGIFYSMLLSYAFHSNDDGVYLQTSSDGRLLWPNFFKVLNFKVHLKDINVQCGGLMMYVRGDLPERRRYDLEECNLHNMSGRIEIMVVEIYLRKDKWLCCSMHKHPSVRDTDLVQILWLLIDKCVRENYNFTILGDLNINVLSSAHCLKDVFETSGVKYLVRTPTCHKSKDYPTATDLVTTNVPKKIKNVQCVGTSLSDFHDMIYFPTKTHRLCSKYILCIDLTSMLMTVSICAT